MILYLERDDTSPCFLARLMDDSRWESLFLAMSENLIASPVSALFRAEQMVHEMLKVISSGCYLCVRHLPTLLEGANTPQVG